jgi:hypothetical protein
MQKRRQSVMSSGIDWKYRVSNADPEQPPISYSVGLAWASGASNRLAVGLVSGLDAVRTAYADLPGLGSHRQLWLKQMSGAAQIAGTASRYLLDVFARKLGKKSPLVHGGHSVETRSVEDWVRDNSFVCGHEIAEYGGVALDAPFLANWELLAIAAEEYPRERWGICPKVKTLKVETWGMDRREVSKDGAARVLDAAEAWSRAVDARTASIEADISLANLLDDEVVKAAIAVTRKQGSLSGLRHTLRVSGYIQ